MSTIIDSTHVVGKGKMVVRFVMNEEKNPLVFVS